MLERWQTPSIAPRSVAAVSRVQDHVLSLLDSERPIVLEIRFDDRSVSARDLAAYLALLDGAFGRTDPRGFRSYSLRARDHLSIDRLQSGSTVLELLLAELGNIGLWRFIVVYLVLRTGPSMLRGDAAKNWADAAKSLGEAAKGLGEAALVWSDVGARVSSSRTRAQLRRRERSAIRRIIQADPLFEGLARLEVDVLVQLVEEVLVAERSHLPAAARFDDAHVIAVALRGSNGNAPAAMRSESPEGLGALASSRSRRKPYLNSLKSISNLGVTPVSMVSSRLPIAVWLVVQIPTRARLDQIEDDSGPVKILPRRPPHRQERVIKRAHLLIQEP